MFRLSVNTDLPAILSLWGEAFGDSPEAVSYFFKSFPNCISYVAEEDGEPAAMVHALPQTLSPDISAAYVYAVATRKSHRGKGLCSRLMAFAEADLQSRGFACVTLTPGEPELFDFYDRLGYRTAFTRRRTPFPGGTPISPEAYLTRRADLLPMTHVVYDEATLRYAAEVYGLQFYETAAGIAAASEGYTAEVLPEDASGDRTGFAMIKWLTTPRSLQNAYLGFALE